MHTAQCTQAIAPHRCTNPVPLNLTETLQVTDPRAPGAVPLAPPPYLLPPPSGVDRLGRLACLEPVGNEVRTNGGRVPARSDSRSQPTVKTSQLYFGPRPLCGVIPRTQDGSKGEKLPSDVGGVTWDCN